MNSKLTIKRRKRKKKKKKRGRKGQREGKRNAKKENRRAITSRKIKRGSALTEVVFDARHSFEKALLISIRIERLVRFR